MLGFIRRNLCHQQRNRFISRSYSAGKSRASTRGALYFDRDYHIHLGGAIPSSFIADWITSGQLSLDDEIPDLVALSSSSNRSDDDNDPKITIRQAILKYRGVASSHQLNDWKEQDLFLSAYNTPSYCSLPTFLTLYRAYSKRSLLYKHASEIARGECVHAFADVRVSIPHPNDVNNNQATESPIDYAKRALDEMMYYNSCLLQSQKLFITFPRQTFNAHKNLDYFNAFLDLLSSTIANRSNNDIAWIEGTQQLAFDFAGQPLPLPDTLPLLDKLRTTFPAAFIAYHHGEVCPHIPFPDRVHDTSLLLPYVNRIGHGLCLGLALLGINPDNYNSDETTTYTPWSGDEDVLKLNKDVATQCLNEMANLDIGIEVSPSCNSTLGGARTEDIFRQYVEEFLDAGVNVFVGTDDPGFLGTSLEKEVAIIKGC